MSINEQAIRDRAEKILREFGIPLPTAKECAILAETPIEDISALSAKVLQRNLKMVMLSAVNARSRCIVCANLTTTYDASGTVVTKCYDCQKEEAEALEVLNEALALMQIVLYATAPGSRAQAQQEVRNERKRS